MFSLANGALFQVRVASSHARSTVKTWMNDGCGAGCPTFARVADLVQRQCR